MVIAIDGSPPRAWGLPLQPLLRSVPARFTPTCVGTTPSLLQLLVGPSVHPHVRGDYIERLIADEVYNGSPPRAWGLHSFLSVGHLKRRFTPTCVGTTN